MSTEIEAKFELSDAAAARRARELARLGSYAMGPAGERRVTDEYFDTPSRDLLTAGWALRIRRQANGCLVTMKSVRSTRADVHVREELEAELPEVECDGIAPHAAPQPARWPVSPARVRLLDLVGDTPLELLFGLEQDRFVREVSDGARRVATASVDEVILSFAGVSRQWWELEVELTGGGTETDLLAMSGWIRATLGLELSAGSKFERALRAVRETSDPHPRLRRVSRRRPPNQRMVVLEAPADAAAGLPLAELSARGYRAHLHRRTTDEIVFHDTHDGALGK